MTTITISLPTQIAKKIDAESKSQGFATRSEFIRSLIRRYFAEESESLMFEEFTPKPLQDVRSAFENTGKYNQEFINSLMDGLAKSSAYKDEDKTTK